MVIFSRFFFRVRLVVTSISFDIYSEIFSLSFSILEILSIPLSVTMSLFFRSKSIFAFIIVTGVFIS